VKSLRYNTVASPMILSLEVMLAVPCINSVSLKGLIPDLPLKKKKSKRHSTVWQFVHTVYLSNLLQRGAEVRSSKFSIILLILSRTSVC
jgi:hypothetical protein